MVSGGFLSRIHHLKDEGLGRHSSCYLFGKGEESLSYEINLGLIRLRANLTKVPQDLLDNTFDFSHSNLPPLPLLNQAQVPLPLATSLEEGACWEVFTLFI